MYRIKERINSRRPTPSTYIKFFPLLFLALIFLLTIITGVAPPPDPPGGSGTT
jgi:hypothetical protein